MFLIVSLYLHNHISDVPDSIHNALLRYLSEAVKASGLHTLSKLPYLLIQPQEHHKPYYTVGVGNVRSLRVRHCAWRLGCT